MKQKWLQIDPRDNVAAVLSDMAVGESFSYNGQPMNTAEPVKAKHKFALCDLPQGTEILMYGVPVGKTKSHVAVGCALTIHNTDHCKQDHIRRSNIPYHWTPPDTAKYINQSWEGYLREDGRYGTRNIWLVIPLVFCENHNVAHMRKAMEEALGYSRSHIETFELSELIGAYQLGHSAHELREVSIRKNPGKAEKHRLFPNVDGIKFLNHQTGCGSTRSDSESFSHLVASYIAHPNCAGATVLSLGCQNAEMKGIQKILRQRAPGYSRKVIWLEQQQFHAEQDFLHTAITETFIGLIDANGCKRTKAPVSALSLGLECGGSDGFSGISANPTLGYVSDVINALGGSTILSEFPELSGVEQNLVDRCVQAKNADRFISLMQQYQQLVKAAGSSFDANPSPGNIRDGLITGAMKSAGAARKGGSAPVQAVLDYTEPIRSHGLHLLCTPGNDVESTTALAGSGANLIAFTTGLGTPTGNPLVPVVKVSSNTTLALRMPQLIDYDAGPVIGGQQLDEAAHGLFMHLLAIASGTSCKAENLGQDDFIPWKRDISL